MSRVLIKMFRSVVAVAVVVDKIFLRLIVFLLWGWIAVDVSAQKQTLHNISFQLLFQRQFLQ